MLSTYQRPVEHEVCEHEIEIKRSRFITLIGRADSEAAARDFIGAARLRFPDARHHCSAFIIHVDEANPIERSSDDGEPSGTAGKPMLEVIKGTGMLDICVVVVRYFGGIKLGAGGLVHAYGDAVRQALLSLDRVTRSRKELYSLRLTHARAGRVEGELRNRGISIVDADYGAQVTLTVALNPGAREDFDASLAALTQGESNTKPVGHAWIERPER
ncbi:YigZ family protein [Corynebacterium flavescens]|uniref:YigZ family protein n=1 Tax=Corynebacterium flavescens TaxID=28028 RepID=UPI00264A2467|nr:YigZ family protein [Corynebacterium flavescens]MDN6099363.1 YigZ family protein [Corynebacterium flavescens]MDN6199126.1 YigZ family protein [Corynebacterium flavescens]MDN6430939.1 YigZ family protein [Corynebacterium flavescens]MDN6600313.1 YigZ family protein [Corynebacterium flavescens]MDN6645526.1 YigZ family protein [Corynebacterium flavescens]